MTPEQLAAISTLSAMEQALECLEWMAESDTPAPKVSFRKAAKDLRTAIEQAEKQEPVAWIEHNTGRNYDEDQLNWQQCEVTDTPLYTHPAPAAPVQEPSTRACRSCGGSGERDTGIAESPTAICKPCAGTGQITTPPAAQRQWVGLADEEVVKVLGTVRESISGNVFLAFAHALEVKLREKNAAAQPAYDQTALELCEVCGWKTLIPGDVCLNCEHEAAAQRQFVGLNEDELKEIFNEPHLPAFVVESVRAIEQKLREKNVGAA